MSNEQQIVSESIEIDAPAGVIFSILADPREHARIDGSGSVRDVIEGPVRLSKGATFGAKMKMFGAPYTISNTVVEFEEDRRIAWRHFGGHRWRYVLEPVTRTRTQVTEQFDYSRHTGLRRRIIEGFKFPARNREGIRQTLVRLKDAAEADRET